VVWIARKAQRLVEIFERPYRLRVCERSNLWSLYSTCVWRLWRETISV